MSSIENIKSTVPKGYIFYGKGPLKHIPEVCTSDIRMRFLDNGSWSSKALGGCGMHYYAIKEGSELAKLNGLTKESKNNNMKDTVPDGYLFYGKGPLKNPSQKYTLDICMYVNNSWSWNNRYWMGNDDTCYYAIKEGSELAKLNGLTKEEKPMNKKDQYITAQKAWMELFDVKKGTKFRVVRQCKTYENGWEQCWVDGMKVGKEVSCNSVMPDYRGVFCSDGYYYPFFALEVIGNLPDSIKISSSYKAEFLGEGKVKVGCQELSFDLVEKIYNAAKSTLNQ